MVNKKELNYGQSVNDGQQGIAIQNMEEKDIIRSQKRIFSGLGLGFFILSIAISVVQLVVIFSVILLWPDVYAKYGNIVGLLPISILGFPAFFIMNKIFKNAPVIEQKYKFGVKQFIPFIFISFGVMMIGNLIGTGINYGIASIAGKEMTVVTAELMSGVDLWQNVLMIAILAPVLEELLFRKLLIDKFSRFGEGVAILTSALMFGLYHGNIVQFIYATALGVVLGYVYSKSRKIHFTIIIHMLINFCSGVFGTYVIGASNMTEISAQLEIYEKAGDMASVAEYTSEHIGEIGLYYGYFSIYGGFIIAGIVLLIVTLVKHIKRGQMILPGAEKLAGNKKSAVVVCNVGAILFLLFWIGMIVYNTYTSYFMPAIEVL